MSFDFDRASTDAAIHAELAKINDRLAAIERKLALIPYVQVLHDHSDIAYVVEAMRAQKIADRAGGAGRRDDPIPVPQR